MSGTDPDGQFDLKPHEYEKIVAPLRREKTSTRALFTSVFWLVMVLLLWPAGVRMADNLGEALYSRVGQVRDALDP